MRVPQHQATNYCIVRISPNKLNYILCVCTDKFTPFSFAFGSHENKVGMPCRKTNYEGWCFQSDKDKSTTFSQIHHLFGTNGWCDRDSSPLFVGFAIVLCGSWDDTYSTDKDNKLFLSRRRMDSYSVSGPLVFASQSSMGSRTTL